MYRTIIELSKEIDITACEELAEVADKAFDNRAGKLTNQSSDSYVLTYEGDEDFYVCIHIGILDLLDSKVFMKHVIKWTYLDTDEPEDEISDVLEIANSMAFGVC